jgi:dsRNA-specific ribonuclease
MLIDDESMKIYNSVFTSATADPDNNYEVFEQLGDVIAGTFIIWYMYRRFPQLQCAEAVKIVARLKINYGARQSFFDIADKLGFWKFISSSEDQRNRCRKDLLEDVLEGFIGATAYILDYRFRTGVGYAITYDILSSIFDEMTISLKYEDLYDSITRLKETFDFFKDKIGGVQKKEDSKDMDSKLTTLRIYIQPPKQLLGSGDGKTIADADNIASRNALNSLRKLGFAKQRYTSRDSVSMVRETFDYFKQIGIQQKEIIEEVSIKAKVSIYVQPVDKYLIGTGLFGDMVEVPITKFPVVITSSGNGIIWSKFGIPIL